MIRNLSAKKKVICIRKTGIYNPIQTGPFSNLLGLAGGRGRLGKLLLCYFKTALLWPLHLEALDQ